MHSNNGTERVRLSSEYWVAVLTIIKPLRGAIQGCPGCEFDHFFQKSTLWSVILDISLYTVWRLDRACHAIHGSVSLQLRVGMGAAVVPPGHMRRTGFPTKVTVCVPVIAMPTRSMPGCMY